MENLNLILPEIFISLSIMFLLILGVFIKDGSKLIFNISLLVLLITAIITINEPIITGGSSASLNIKIPIIVTNTKWR